MLDFYRIRDGVGDFLNASFSEKEKEQVYKPNPVTPLKTGSDDHPSGPDIAIGFKRPTRPDAKMEQERAALKSGPIWSFSAQRLPRFTPLDVSVKEHRHCGSYPPQQFAPT